MAIPPQWRRVSPMSSTDLLLAMSLLVRVAEREQHPDHYATMELGKVRTRLKPGSTGKPSLVIFLNTLIAPPANSLAAWFVRRKTKAVASGSSDRAIALNVGIDTDVHNGDMRAEYELFKLIATHVHDAVDEYFDVPDPESSYPLETLRSKDFSIEDSATPLYKLIALATAGAGPKLKCEKEIEIEYLSGNAAWHERKYMRRKIEY